MAYDASEFRGPGGVNVANILRVADAVERSKTFSMVRGMHPCGTPACVAGHAYHIETGLTGEYAHIADPAQAFLGLTDEMRRSLFAPGSTFNGFGWYAEPGDPDYITNAHAAACLRKLAATGEVDWLGTKPASPTKEA